MSPPDVGSILCHGPQTPDNGQIRNWHLETQVISSVQQTHTNVDNKSRAETQGEILLRDDDCLLIPEAQV